MKIHIKIVAKKANQEVTCGRNAGWKRPFKVYDRVNTNHLKEFFHPTCLKEQSKTFKAPLFKA